MAVVRDALEARDGEDREVVRSLKTLVVQDREQEAELLACLATLTTSWQQNRTSARSS
jgi:hypothetical protein